VISLLHGGGYLTVLHRISELKGCVWSRSWLSVALEWPRKTMKGLCQGSWFPGWDLNAGPDEYKAEALLIASRAGWRIILIWISVQWNMTASLLLWTCRRDIASKFSNPCTVQDHTVSQPSRHNISPQYHDKLRFYVHFISYIPSTLWPLKWSVSYQNETCKQCCAACRHCCWLRELVWWCGLDSSGWECTRLLLI
jgi:hypothetical protein